MTQLGFHCHSLDHFEEAITSNELKRGEFYNFPSHNLPELRDEVQRHDIAASVHAPLVRVPWYPSPPTLSFLCDVDEEKRQMSLRMIEETMETAKDFGAEYVVVHFPVPSTTGVNVSKQELHRTAMATAAALSQLSEQHQVLVHMEGFGPSPLLDAGFLLEVIESFPGLRYCFDTGHMHVASQRDGFDLYKFAARLGPHIGSVHLWNSRGLHDYLTYGHIPVHPEQSPDEGWVDVPRILELLVSGSPDCRIILESGLHYPKALGGRDFRDGVKWIKRLLAQ